MAPSTSNLASERVLPPLAMPIARSSSRCAWMAWLMARRSSPRWRKVMARSAGPPRCAREGERRAEVDALGGGAGERLLRRRIDERLGPSLAGDPTAVHVARELLHRRSRLPFAARLVEQLAPSLARSRAVVYLPGVMGAHVDDSPLPPVRFETHPDRYRHWRLELPAEYGGAVARLVMDVREDEGLRPGYPLKLNSYDLGVDIELADALQRIRFEHPEVKALVFTSGKDRIFCSGANIYMLGSSTHAFKVNFCKFTNETRLDLEEMSAESGVAQPRGAGRHRVGRRVRARPRVRRDRPRRRRVERGQLARGAAARRAPGHRRAHAPGRQAQGAARPAPTCSPPSPRACAASARSSGDSSTRRPRKKDFEARGEAAARRAWWRAASAVPMKAVKLDPLGSRAPLRDR